MPTRPDGVSGWRPGHVSAVASTSDGLRALRAWSIRWAQGTFQFRDRWAVSLALPLRKVRGDGSIDVRNIVLAEPLVQLASCTVYALHSRRAVKIQLHQRFR